MNKNENNSCTHRECYKCREVKALTPENFHRSKNRQLGFEYKCKECYKLRKQKPRGKRVLTEEQKERKRELQKIYQKTIKYKALSLKCAYEKFDRSKNYFFDLTQDDLREALNSNCTYCGFPATGMDRIDNNLGHTKENCIPACMHCNVARMDNFSHEEMFIIGEAIRKVRLLRLIEEENKQFITGTEYVRI
jgi:hypothetical protein